MAGRILSNLGLKAFFSFGEDGWNDEVDTNFLKLSVLVQAGAIDLVTVKPTSPNEGDVYVMGSGAASNANTVAVYDNGAWQHFAAKAGWAIYNQTDDSYVQWTGSEWAVLALPVLRALSALPEAAGAVVQSSDGAFSITPVGASDAGDLLRRSDGDTRYAASGHTHPVTGVTTFNTRDGAITLVASDINTALGRDANSAANSTGLSAFSADSTGVIEKTGAGAFTTRTIGVGSAESIPTRALADARYAAFSSTLLGFATTLSQSGTGLVQQIAPNTFTHRQIGGALGTDILSRADADAIYIPITDAITETLNDKQVKQSVIDDATTARQLAVGDAGQFLRMNNAAATTVTLPLDATAAIPVGSTVLVQQAGAGLVSFVAEGAAIIEKLSSKTLASLGQGAVVRAVKVAIDTWSLSGDLA